MIEWKITMAAQNRPKKDKIKRGRPEKYKGTLKGHYGTILQTLLLHQPLTQKELIKSLLDLSIYRNKDRKDLVNEIGRTKTGNLDRLEEWHLIEYGADDYYRLTQNKGLFTAIYLILNPTKDDEPRPYLIEDLTPCMMEQIVETNNLKDIFTNFSDFTFDQVSSNEVIDKIFAETKQIMNNSTDFFTKTNQQFNNEFVTNTFFKYNQIDTAKLIESYKKIREDHYLDMVTWMNERK
jgi:hypothetical protein